MKKFLAGIFGALATIALTTAIFSYVVNDHILNPQTILGSAEASGTYEAISREVPQAFTSQASPDEAAVIKTEFAKIITPAYVRIKITSLVMGLDGFLRQGQPAPTINFSDIVTGAAANGFALPQELTTQLNQPIVVGPTDPRQVELAHTADTWLARGPLLGLGITIILLILVALMSQSGRRSWGIAKVLIMTALSLAISAFFLRALPAMVNAQFTANPQTKPIGAIIQPLLSQIISTTNNLVFRIALGLVILSAAGIIAELVFNIVTHRHGGGHLARKKAIEENL